MPQDLQPCHEVLGNVRWAEHTQPAQGAAPRQTQAELTRLSAALKLSVKPHSDSSEIAVGDSVRNTHLKLSS